MGRQRNSRLTLDYIKDKHLALFLFVIVLDVISEVWRDGIPWELLFANDLALIAESEAGL